MMTQNCVDAHGDLESCGKVRRFGYRDRLLHDGERNPAPDRPSCRFDTGETGSVHRRAVVAAVAAQRHIVTSSGAGCLLGVITMIVGIVLMLSIFHHARNRLGPNKSVDPSAIEGKNMNREISLWGVGPRIVLTAVLYAVVAGAATWQWPGACLVTAVSYVTFFLAGIVLLVIGVPMLVVAARAATIVLQLGQTRHDRHFWPYQKPDLCGLDRVHHPWTGPDESLVAAVLDACFAYMVFKAQIGRENKYLEKRFGDASTESKAKVNELMPYPRKMIGEEHDHATLRLEL